MQDLQGDSRRDQDHEIRDGVQAGAGLAPQTGAPGQPAVQDVGAPGQQQAEKRQPAVAERGRAHDRRRQGNP